MFREDGVMRQEDMALGYLQVGKFTMQRDMHQFVAKLAHGESIAIIVAENNIKWQTDIGHL